MKYSFKRFLALALAFVMVAGMLPSHRASAITNGSVTIIDNREEPKKNVTISNAPETQGNGNVAKVGTTEYATIGEAIAAWTNNTTLTLLADVTLADVVTLNSTEHHILDLGTYTMTAAEGKNAFVIKACGTGSAERTAITINADATNPGGINAGNKCVIYYKYADGGISTEDRPIIKINGGVFTGSTSSFGTAGIYTIGTAARKCATLNITGGTFNCSINGSGKSKLLVYGGTFNYSVGSQGDSTALRLISGGKFKTLGFMTADSNNTKFWFGTSMANSNVGLYVDKEGYLVVGGPVITELSSKYVACVSNATKWSSYLQYSSAATYGLFYEDAAMAIAKHGAANVTVYEKPAVTIPDTLTGEVVEEIKKNTALKDYAPENLPEGAELEIELVSVGETIVYDVTPMANGTEVEPTQAITFRLPVPASVAKAYAKVYHDGTLMGIYEVKGEGNAKYVEISSADFSEFAVEPIVHYEVSTYEELLAALENNNAFVKLMADITATATQSSGYGKAGIVLDAGDVLDGNAHKLTINGANGTWDCAIAMKGGEVKNLTIAGAMRGVFMPGANGDVVIDHCVFENVIYTFNSDAGSKDYTVTIKNTVLNGWTSFSAVHKSVTFEGCTFGEGSGYAFCRPYQATTFVDCDFAEGYEFDTSKAADNTLEFTDCTYNGEPLSIANKDMFYNNGDVKIDGVETTLDVVALIGSVGYATLAEAIAAVKEGETIIILAGTYSEGTIKLPATLKNVTIKGAEGAILKDMTISAADGNAYSYIGLTFDGITFDNSRLLFTGWRNGEEIIQDLTITNCVFKNLNDSTNTAPVHINKDAAEAVVNFTFTNNVIDGAIGGSKSGVYAQLTGKVVFTGNVINNVSFRPYVIQITTDDGIADEFIVTGNTFSGSKAGRAQGLGNNAAGTDTVKLVVSGNIFKGITESQQICYWNFNPEKTTADLSKNYYDIDIKANPSKIYFNSAAQNKSDLADMGIFPYYSKLNEDGTIDTDSLVGAPVFVAQIDNVKYESLEEAVAAVKNGETITLLADITENVTLTEKAGLYYTIDGNGKTMNGTITISSLSDTNDNRRITIKNIKFVKQDVAVDFISSVNKNHYPRLTIEGCSFTGTGNGDTVAVRLKSSHSVVIKDCTGTGLHSFLQNTAGWNLTIENVTVTDSKGGLSLGTVQGVTIKDCKIDVAGYGIRMDAQYNNNAVIESNKVKAFIPVVVRKASVESNVTFKGTNEFTATNTDGYWCVIGTSEYEENGSLPTASTANVYVKLEDTGLNRSGIYGHYAVAQIGSTKYESLQAAIEAVQDGGTIVLLNDVVFTENTRTHNSGSWYDGIYYVGDKSFTIDLGGFTITHDGSVNDYLLNFKNVGSKANTITIKNGTVDAGTNAFCALCTSGTQENQLTINLENVTLINNISNGSVAKIRGGVILNVKAGTKIIGKNSYLGIENYASIVNIYDGAEIYMNGTSSYNGCLVGVAYGGTVNVYGGYGKGVKGGFIAMTSGGTINISGGEWIANTDGTVGGNSNLYVLTAQNNSYESGYVGASIINVTGGTFRGGMDAWVLNSGRNEKAELNISGGNFNVNPSAYVKGSCAVKANTDGTYSVSAAAAKIGDTYYATLADAIAAAKDGDIVVIMPGEYGAIDISNKNITIAGTVGANGELLTTIKGGNPAITGHGFNGTIKDLKIVDAFKVMYAEPAGNVTVDNVYVTGATYGLHLVAYSKGLTWTIQNSYMDLSWANSFGVYGDGDAEIIIKGNKFEATAPYYPDYGALPVNTFMPQLTVEDNIFGENTKIYIDSSVTDTSKINISKNYHADGADNVFAVDEDGVTLYIHEYYADEAMTQLVKRYVQIGDTYYATLAEAAAAAQAGDEIVLLANVAVDSTLALPGGIKLTSNGYTITGSIRMLGNLELNGPLTITGGLWVGKSGETLTATLSGDKLTASYFMFQYGTYTINADIDAVYGYLSFNGTFEVNSTIHTTGANGEVLYINGNVTLNDGAVLDSDNSVFVCNDNAVLTLKAGSKVDSNVSITKSGAKVYIDATGMAAGDSANITGKVTNSGNGTIAVVGNDKLEAKIVDGKIVLSAKPVAKIGDTYYATLEDAIAAAKAGDTVYIFEGTYAVPSMKAGITVEGIGNVLLEGTLSGTLENLTLKNLHIKGASAQRWAYAKGNLVFENVTFEATSVYALHFDGITEGTTLLYKDCTIIGWAAMGGSPASCVFDGCTIKGNGTYGVIRTYFDATIENCTFDVANTNPNDVYQDGIHAVDGATVTVNNCTNVNGDMKDIVNVHATSTVVVDDVVIQNVAKIGDTYYLTLAEAIEAFRTGDSIVLVRDVAENVSVNKSIALDLNGKEMTGTITLAAMGVTLTAAEDLNVVTSVTGYKVAYADGVHYLKSAIEAWIAGTNGIVYYDSLENAIKAAKEGETVVLMANVTVNGYLTIDKNITIMDYNSVTITFVEGGFYLEPEVNLTISGVKLSGCNVYSDELNSMAKVNGMRVTGIQGKVSALLATITENGDISYQLKNPTWAARIGDAETGDYYETLADAIKAANDGAVIEMLADAEASKVIEISKSLTINGNGHKITSSASRVIRVTTSNLDVTLNDVNMVSTAVRVGSNDIRGISVDSGLTDVKLTLNNCSVDFTDASACDWAYAVNITGGNGYTITVNGGTYEGANVINVRGENQTVIVKNATLTSLYPNNDVYFGAGIWVQQENGSSVFAEGNIFNGNNAIAFNLGTGTALTESGNTDNTKLCVAKIGDTYYTSLVDAFAAAQDGDTIKLLHHVALDETITNTKKITLDLNGKTITGTDNATGSFGLFTNKGELTITGNGKITLVANNNRGWNAYSSVISNTVGGKLIVESGTIEHLGGTDMAYAIDNLTNGKGTYAETVINGGTIKSTYRAIRQFLNGTEAQNILTINGGTIEGANKSIWMQDPSANANSGTLTVGANAVLKGNVYLTVTAGSTEWPVEVSIAQAALNGESKVLTNNVPADYDVQLVDGCYTVLGVVAKIGDIKYPTLAAALAAAKDGDVIELIWAEGNAPIAMNGSVFGKTVTITGTATVDWSKGFLFVGRGGEGNGTVIFDNAHLTSASDNASYGIHVSGREKNTNNKYDGTLIIRDSVIELDYLINKGTMTLENSTLTVKNGFSVGGRPASETESGADATATLNLTNGSKLIVNNHNGMGLGYEAIGVMNVDATSTFETTQSFLVTAKGTMNIAGTVKIAGTLTNNGAINLTDSKATLEATEGLNIISKVNNYMVDYADGVYSLKIENVAWIMRDGSTMFFTSLEAAIDAALDGETIVLMGNITVDSLEISKNLTIADYDFVTLTVTEKITVSGCTLTIDRVNVEGEIVLADANATLKAAAGLNVTTSAGCSAVEYDGETYKVVVAHTPGEAVKENETPGSYESVVYCTECGVELSRETVTTGPVADADATINLVGLVLKDYIGLQLAVDKNTMNNGVYDKAYYAFVQYNPDGTEAANGTIEFNMAAGKYVGAEFPVLAWSMSDEFVITVYYEVDGITYVGGTTTTSVKEQAMIRIANNNNKDLCIAMLNYGAEVQKYFDHYDSDTSYLANCELTEEQTALPSFDSLNLGGEIVMPDGMLKPATKGLSARDKINLQFAVKNQDLSGYEVRYTVDGVEQAVIPYSQFMTNTVNGVVYCGPSIAMTPMNMRSEIVIGFYDAATGEKVYGDIVCSVEAFAKLNQGKATEQLTIAMMVYGDAAAAAFGKK